MRYGVNNDPKDGEMEKRPTFAQNMDEYIFKILPSHTHPSTDSLNYGLNWEFSWTINPWCIIIHRDEMCKTKVTIQKDDEMEETTSLYAENVDEY